MGSIAYVCVSLLSSSAVSLAGAFSFMRLAHPTTRPLFDVVFALVYSVLLALVVMLVMACFPSVFRASPETTTLLVYATGASIIGIWLSVGVHAVGSMYDKFALKIKQPVMKHGWPWVAFNSCFTHVCTALLLGGITVIAMTKTQLQSGGGLEFCGVCDKQKADDSSSDSSSSDSSSDSSSESSTEELEELLDQVEDDT